MFDSGVKKNQLVIVGDLLIIHITISRMLSMKWKGPPGRQRWEQICCFGAVSLVAAFIEHIDRMTVWALTDQSSLISAALSALFLIHEGIDFPF